MSRFEKVIEGIDAYNARDPRRIGDEPYEVQFSKWMTEWVMQLRPEPCEGMQIAARAFHIGRWEVPRSDYPEGLIGYMQWREGLKVRHAEKAAEIMREHGYPEEPIERVGRLIRKDLLGEDACCQVLEDAVCLVFLEHQFSEFAEKHPDEKVVDILQKTWPKMSIEAQQKAMMLPFDDRAMALIGQALSA